MPTIIANKVLRGRTLRWDYLPTTYRSDREGKWVWSLESHKPIPSPNRTKLIVKNPTNKNQRLEKRKKVHRSMVLIVVDLL